MKKKKEEYIMKGKEYLETEEYENFKSKYLKILSKAKEERKKDLSTNSYKREEINLINSLVKYCRNHLLFLKKFFVPFSNNRAESDLRGILETISNLFEGKEIRSAWDSEKEEYYFSIVDIIGALTDSNIPRNYWSDLKRKLKQEGSLLHENIVQLKMKSQKDGKRYLTDTLDTHGILRLIESIPSPKAEPFKLWSAQMGKERIDEVFDPEFAVNRAVDYYRAKGYDDKWIKARLTEL